MTPFWNWMQGKIGFLVPKTKREGYCLHCRTHKMFTVAHDKILKNGRRAIQGVCPDCQGKISKLIAI